MSYVAPFNAVELQTVNIDGKTCVRAKEVCRTLILGKTTKTADVVKHLYSLENCAQKCQLTEFLLKTKPVNWSKDS